jgi:uncharacterized protein YdbL (DUF1318 family)
MRAIMNYILFYKIIYQRMSIGFFLIPFLFTFCFSELRPPPITFTQTQTAAEKQMIGEDKELEKDSWLIASIKSSASGAEDWKGEVVEEFSDPQLEKEFLILQRTNTYTASEIRKLKSYGVIGEGLDGYLMPIKGAKSTGFEKDYSTPETKKRFEELIELVNQTRKRLRDIRLEKMKNKLNPEDFKKLESVLILEYWENTFTGDYYEVSKGKWRQKE